MNDLHLKNLDQFLNVCFKSSLTSNFYEVYNLLCINNALAGFLKTLLEFFIFLNDVNRQQNFYVNNGVVWLFVVGEVV